MKIEINIDEIAHNPLAGHHNALKLFYYLQTEILWMGQFIESAAAKKTKWKIAGLAA